MPVPIPIDIARVRVRLVATVLPRRSRAAGRGEMAATVGAGAPVTVRVASSMADPENTQELTSPDGAYLSAWAPCVKQLPLPV